MARSPRSALASSLFFAQLLATAAASAQPAPTPAPLPPPSAPAPGPSAPTPASAPPLVPRAEIVPWVQVKPGGPTADSVGARAAETSYTAKAAEEAMRSAAARVDQAWVQFLPRLSATARYTRLSSFTPPALFSSTGGSLVGTPARSRYRAVEWRHVEQ